MRPQLAHLVMVCLVMLSLISFARANQGDDDDERSMEFKRLFGETSEPLEPEEAKRLIANSYYLHRGRVTPKDSAERKEFQTQLKLLRSLVEFEGLSADCGRDFFLLVDKVAESIEKLPALKNYFSDRRDRRLLESCSRRIAKNLQTYKSESYLLSKYSLDTLFTIKVALESLNQVPAQVVLGENWLEKKSNQVSAALFAVMQTHVPYFKPADDEASSPFRQLFEHTVERDCEILPSWPEIIPDYMEEYFIREGKLEQLDSTAVNWHKLDRTCELIRQDPDLASDIVSEYKDKLQKEEQGQMEKWEKRSKKHRRV